MQTGNQTPVSFTFNSTAFDSELFDVMEFTGEEEISRPYEFEIDLVSENPDIDLDKLLFAPATLGIEKGRLERKIHGVVSECRLLDAMPDQRFHYWVVLVPRIKLLALSRQNQIYQSLSVPDIVSQEIKSSTAKGVTKDASAGLMSDDYELRLTRDYPKREYVVQYDESDLDFISRLMEHEGIFYFFEQGDDREKIIITDNNIHFPGLGEEDTLVYSPVSGLARSDDEAVLSISATNRRIPRKLVLKDYNYRLPHVMLQAEAEIDPDAHGLISQYGDHFKEPEEGARLARIRAQELRCTKQIFEVRSDSARLHAGVRFKLDEHFRQAFNAEYVITGLASKGRQPLEGVSGNGANQAETATYGNTFTCIPAPVDYRPPRLTPKPIIPGMLNAHVDAALLEDRAEMDDQGRYKLVMPFDLSGTAAGKATRFVRKAQPYGGRDMGMHFPLHKGTEVVCNFINGDPDRPIIAGVVPNPLNPSVVTSDNYHHNVLKTASGCFMAFNDGVSRSKSNQNEPAQSDPGELTRQQNNQSIGLCALAGHCSGTNDTGHILEAQQQKQDTGLSTVSEQAKDKWIKVAVPDHTDNMDTYLRLGHADPNDGEQPEIKHYEQYAVGSNDKIALDTFELADIEWKPNFIFTYKNINTDIKAVIDTGTNDTFKTDGAIKGTIKTGAAGKSPYSFTVCGQLKDKDFVSATIELTIGEAGQTADSKTGIYTLGGSNLVLNCKEGDALSLTPVVADDAASFALSNRGGLAGLNCDAQTGTVTGSIAKDKARDAAYALCIDVSNKAQTETIAVDLELQIRKLPAAGPGWYDYTDGNYTSIAKGDRYVRTQGDYENSIAFEDGVWSWEHVAKDRVLPLLRKREIGWKSETSLCVGSEESCLLGNKLEANLGLVNELAVALASETFIGAKVETHLDWNVNYGKQGTVDLVDGTDYKFPKDEIIEADENICFSVPLKDKKQLFDADQKAKSDFLELAVWGTAAGLAAGGAAALQTAVSKKMNLHDVFQNFASVGISGGLSAAAVAAIVLSNKYVKESKARKKKRVGIGGKDDESRIEITQKDIELACGANGLVITPEKLEIKVGESKIAMTEEEIIFKCGKNTISISKDEIKTFADSILLSATSGNKITLGEPGNTYPGRFVRIGKK